MWLALTAHELLVRATERAGILASASGALTPYQPRAVGSGGERPDLPRLGKNSGSSRPARMRAAYAMISTVLAVWALGQALPSHGSLHNAPPPVPVSIRMTLWALCASEIARKRTAPRVRILASRIVLPGHLRERLVFSIQKHGGPGGQPFCATP